MQCLTEIFYKFKLSSDVRVFLIDRHGREWFIETDKTIMCNMFVETQCNITAMTHQKHAAASISIISFENLINLL